MLAFFLFELAIKASAYDFLGVMRPVESSSIAFVVSSEQVGGFDVTLHTRQPTHPSNVHLIVVCFLGFFSLVDFGFNLGGLSRSDVFLQI